ncbi:MAG: 3-deoxy-manno-octulosonate cytidylyltransferase [Gemmatimonadetes bacterium]|nr:3-deoxy-manno-octulosonate cytidylyltransferase [Gemmatimonadota bacterium]
MSILIVIPARLGATRLANKPLRMLGGVPLVVRVLERLAEVAPGYRAVVATDSEEIRAVVAAAGGESVMTSPAHSNGTERVAEVAKLQAFADAHVLVNVQGDEPFLPDDAITAAVDRVTTHGDDVGTVAAPLRAAVAADPAVVKVVRDDNGRALYFSRALIPFAREAADAAIRDALLLRHVGLYAFTRESLARWVALPPHPLELAERLEQLRPLAGGFRIGVAKIATAGPGGIDTETDLERANAAWPAWPAFDQSPVPAGTS